MRRADLKQALQVLLRGASVLKTPRHRCGNGYSAWRGGGEEEREGGGGGRGEEEEGRGKKSYLSCKVMGGSGVK